MNEEKLIKWCDESIVEITINLDKFPDRKKVLLERIEYFKSAKKVFETIDDIVYILKKTQTDLENVDLTIEEFDNHDFNDDLYTELLGDFEILEEDNNKKLALSEKYLDNVNGSIGEIINKLEELIK